jgi:hypothetical protein
MKLFKKILKWTGITILTIVVIFVIIVFSLQNKKFDAPFPSLHATNDSATIARGNTLLMDQRIVPAVILPRKTMKK